MQDYMVSSVILWGRSMGASTSILYMSPKFRKLIIGFLKERKNVQNYSFHNPVCVRGLILDSPFGNLPTNIVNFVAAKAPKVPEILVRLAIKILDRKKIIKIN
jgi:hypothetical protein